METVKRWLREWLGVADAENWAHNNSVTIAAVGAEFRALKQRCETLTKENDELARFIKHELAEIRKDMVRFTLETYSPPKPEDRTPKVKKTRTFKEFSDTLEQNFEAEEARSAER